MWLRLLLYAPTMFMFPPFSFVRERRQNQVFFPLSRTSDQVSRDLLGLSLLCLWCGRGCLTLFTIALVTKVDRYKSIEKSGNHLYIPVLPHISTSDAGMSLLEYKSRIILINLFWIRYSRIKRASGGCNILNIGYKTVLNHLEKAE